MKKVVIAVVMLAALAAHAQKTSPWAKEPSAVFGIALGEVLDNSSISECGGVKVEGSGTPVSVCAMNRPGFGGILIAGFPVPAFESGFVQREDGVVTAIALHGKHDDYQSIKTLLIERYGRPTLVRTDTLQNGLGAIFKSERSSWIGKQVTLTLKERGDEIDKTSAYFSHNATAMKNLLNREKSLKDSASKM